MSHSFYMPLLLATAICLVLIAYVSRRQSGLGKNAFIVLMFGLAIWSFSYALQLNSGTEVSAELWRKIKYTGIVMIPPAWLILSLQVTGQDKALERIRPILLTIEPLLMLALLWTNSSHYLVWLPGPHTGYAQYGPAFFIHTAYSYLFLGWGTLLILRFAIGSSSLFRGQAMALLLGALAPWTGNLLYVSQFPLPGDIDPTPLLFALTSPVLAWSLFRFHLIDLTPIDPEAILDNLHDPVLVLDSNSRVVNLNLAAAQLLSQPAASLIGGPGAPLLPELKDLLDQPPSPHTSRLEIEREPARSFDVHISPLYNHNQRLTGRMIIYHEITDRKAAEAALRQTLSETQTLYQVTRAAIASTELPTTLQNIANSLAESLEAASLSVLILDLERKRILRVINAPCNGSIEQAQTLTYQGLMEGLVGRVIHSRQAALSPADEPDERESAANQKWRANQGNGCLLAAPMVFQEQVQGAIVATRTAGQPNFTSRDVDLIATLAGQAAVVIENARLLREERSQRDQAETLREVAHRLTATLDRSLVLSLVLEQLARVIDYDSASVMLFSEEDGLGIVAQQRFRNPDQISFTNEMQNLPHIAEVLNSQKALIIPDTRTDPRWLRQPVSDYIRCWLGVPLIGYDRVIGLINLDKKETGYYDQQDADLAQAFANQAAIAIENARLFEAEQQRAQEAETLRQVGATILSTLNLDETIQQILAQLERVIPFDTASVQLMRGDCLEIVGGSGWSQPERVLGRRLPIPSNNPNTVVVRDCQIVLLDDAPSQFASFKEDIYSKIRSWLGVPLIAQDRVIGMLALDSYRPHHFKQAHARLARGFANQVAIALENSRLYQSAKEAAERRAVLHEVSQEIVAASLDAEGIYASVHNAASRLMSTEAFVIALFDKEDQMIDAVYLIDRGGRTPSRRIPWGQGLSGAVIASGESVLISDLPADLESGEPTATGSIRFGAEEDVRSILGVPMRLGGKITGMISAQSYLANDYSLEDQHLLEMLASYAAIALENLHLFKEVQRLAITDSLTELHNRRHLFQLGEREFHRARRFERPLSAILVDIDHFKSVNDRYGHATGDLVLKVLAQRLLLFVREVDIVGRYGGEEFVILLPETSLETATRVAERLRTEIQQPFNLGDGRSLTITVSLGVSTTSGSAANLATLIHQADIAMYSAKNAGRNRVVAR